VRLKKWPSGRLPRDAIGTEVSQTARLPLAESPRAVTIRQANSNALFLGTSVRRTVLSRILFRFWPDVDWCRQVLRERNRVKLPGFPGLGFSLHESRPKDYPQKLGCLLFCYCEPDNINTRRHPFVRVTLRPGVRTEDVRAETYRFFTAGIRFATDLPPVRPGLFGANTDKIVGHLSDALGRARAEGL
jgi:hypothetical protein